MYRLYLSPLISTDLRLQCELYYTVLHHVCRWALRYLTIRSEGYQVETRL